MKALSRLAAIAASAKQAIAIRLHARKIEARKGGSITKNRIDPLISANTAAVIAIAVLTLNSCLTAPNR